MSIFFSVKTVWQSVTLKYNQGHWKWYEYVKLNEYYNYAKFAIYHIYGVRENRNVKVFATYGHSASRPNTDHYMDTFFMQVKNQTKQTTKNDDRKPNYT